MNGHVHGVDAVRVLRENLAEIEEGAVIARRIRERAGLPSEDGSVAEYREVVAALFELIKAGAEFQAAIDEATEQLDVELWMSGKRVSNARGRFAVTLAHVQPQEAGD